MVDPNDAMTAVNGRLTNVLDVAEAALSPPQYEAFRRVVLREFGDKGLKADLRGLAKGNSGGGLDGNGTGRR